MMAVPAYRKLKQEDHHELEASMRHTVSSRPAEITDCLKNFFIIKKAKACYIHH